jgi:hypothetical protein
MARSPHVRLLGAQVLATISLILFVRLFLIPTTLLCVSLLDGLAFWAGFLLLGIRVGVGAISPTIVAAKPKISLVF